MDFCSCKAITRKKHEAGRDPVFDCICDSISQYFTECKRLGVELPGGWRSENLCPRKTEMIGS
ncbi:hypothetical protein BGZ63DRAFT_391478 [Mariannaea sp. PMI_226]|nr:hypothetical protein BGZ63DRAFT_391478 [Mariannaea sp. PMI_226]